MGGAMNQQLRQIHNNSAAPLDPVEFQKELEKRTEAERIQMENFKAHEEKMKAFQAAKKKKERPKRADSSSLQLE